MLYNDAYRPVFGAKHPEALGLAGRDAWREIWDSQLHALLASVVRTGEAFCAKDLLFEIERHGFPEETYFDVSYDPVRVESGDVGGVYCIVTETTERVVGERRLALLRDLAARNATARTVAEACILVTETLAANSQDILFALMYLGDELQSSTPGAPEQLARSRCELVKDLPILKSSQETRGARLVVGLNPKRPFDDQYRSFVDLVADQCGTAIANARAYEQERQRAEVLAELDRAKTTFFSNVSHEFRTPLTLLVGPLEDGLADVGTPLPPVHRERQEVAHRNALRLLRLVNTLLDFSRIEAGRVEASYEPVDLAAFTAELASIFRSAIEHAGLRLTIECPPLPAPMYVDREMWEKVVLNLLSNALKYTFEGEIGVRLTWLTDRVELCVSDTGIGIAAADLPRLFERFHRIRGTRARTQEGTGIGLALVQELVRLHAGTITVDSTVDRGTTFVVSLPTGAAHLPTDRVKSTRAVASTSMAAAYLNAAAGWADHQFAVTRDDNSLAGMSGDTARSIGDGERDRLVLADDNTDMRDYLRRLLGAKWDVDAYGDGAAAWHAIREHRPDLVLADVMMPGLNGFELLRSIRADERTRDVPVVLLSARAGEEARVEGMEAGADDYLVKPFSARELLARVGAHLDIARVRRDADQQLRESETRYRLLVEQTVDGIFVSDAEGHYVDVNPAGCAMLGMTREEVLNSSFTDVLVPEDHDRIGPEVARFDDGSIARSEWQFRRKDDSTFVGEVVGRKLPNGHLQGIVRDITERRKSEEGLRVSEEFNRTVLENSPDCVKILDREGRLRFMNTNGLCLLEIEDFARFEGRFWWTLWAEESRPLVKASVDKALRGETARFQAFSPTAQGTPRWWDVIVTPVPGASGKPEQLISVSRDITDRKAVEEALRQSEAQLRQASHMKDEFLATLSHELRTPLNAMLGWSQMLRTGTLKADVAARAFDSLERNAKAQAQLVDDLLDMSRIVSGKLQIKSEPVDLTLVVSSAVDTVRPSAASKGVALQVSGEIDAPVNGDADRLRQVVWNLLSNAVKFTPSGGKVQVVLHQSDSGVEIAVRDTGQGIAEQFLPFVFDRFRQADGTTTRRYGGLGLGLAIVRHLTEAHGGTATVESEGQNKGAAFTIQLPVAADSSPRSTSVPPVRRKTGKTLQGMRILAVDDEADARDLLRVVLEAESGSVIAVGSAGEALHRLQQDRFDVLLADIGMPDQDGLWLIRAVRDSSGPNGQLPAIAVTAYASLRERERALEAGYNWHLPKPVESEQLVAAVAQVMQSRGDGSGRRSRRQETVKGRTARRKKPAKKGTKR